jgi:hypothetical protein
MGRGDVLSFSSLGLSSGPSPPLPSSPLPSPPLPLPPPSLPPPLLPPHTPPHPPFSFIFLLSLFPFGIAREE